MAWSGEKLQWPAKEDVQDVSEDTILCKILTPRLPISSRHFVLDQKEKEREGVDNLQYKF